MRAWWLVPLVLAVMLAGCAAKPPPGTPEERAHRAVSSFAYDIIHPGNLSKISGTVSARGIGVPFTVEFGRDGGRHLVVSVATFSIDEYCLGNLTLRVTGAVVTAARSNACSLEGNQYSAPLALLDKANLTSARVDGNELLATFNATAGDVRVTIDALDRVRHVSFATQGGTLAADIEYGAPPKLDVPGATQRAAAVVRASETFAVGTTSWEATEVPYNVSLNELEVRVGNATFHPEQGTASASGYDFAFTDADHNERLSRGDSFRLTNASGGRSHPTVWDTWADAAVVERSAQVPGMGVLGALFALGAVAVAYGRQRG